MYMQGYIDVHVHYVMYNWNLNEYYMHVDTCTMYYMVTLKIGIYNWKFGIIRYNISNLLTAKIREFSTRLPAIRNHFKTFWLSLLFLLSLRFHQSDILSYLLTPAPVEARKRLPSQANPDLASEIRELVSQSLVSWYNPGGEWTCHYINQLTTFLLPSGEFN